MNDDPPRVTIRRRFDAPPGDVWAMWTDPARFRTWYGPKGMSVPVAEMDLTVGGTRRIAMTTPDGSRTMWFTGVFKEISPPSRLMYTEAMCDEDGTLIPPAAMGMPEGTPDITEVIVDLAARDGGTEMTMTHIGVPEGSAGEGGWQQAFDALADALNG